MEQDKMWIDGKWVDAESGKTYPVFNPATEEDNCPASPGW